MTSLTGLTWRCMTSLTGLSHFTRVTPDSEVRTFHNSLFRGENLLQLLVQSREPSRALGSQPKGDLNICIRGTTLWKGLTFSLLLMCTLMSLSRYGPSGPASTLVLLNVMEPLFGQSSGGGLSENQAGSCSSFSMVSAWRTDTICYIQHQHLVTPSVKITPTFSETIC